MGTIWVNIRRRLVFRRCPGRRTMIVLAALVILGLGHGPILRLLAWPLMAEGTAQRADFYCLHGDEFGADGYEPFEHAAAWYAEGPARKVLLLLPPDSRIVEIGAVPSFERMCRQELDKRGIPASDVETARAAPDAAWGEARRACLVAGTRGRNGRLGLHVRGAAAGCGTSSTRPSVLPTPHGSG